MESPTLYLLTTSAVINPSLNYCKHGCHITDKKGSIQYFRTINTIKQLTILQLGRYIKLENPASEAGIIFSSLIHCAVIQYHSLRMVSHYTRIVKT